jgi:hypothetical protein
MATELTIQEFSRNAQTTETSAGLSIAKASSGAYVDVGDVDASKLFFRIETTAADTDDYLVISDGAQFSGGTMGDLNVYFTATELWVGPLETHRFKDSDGYINIDKTTGTGDSGTATVQAFLLP